MRPTPAELGDLIAALVGSRWPTTEAERLVWFDEHGVVVEGAESLPREGLGESWVGSGSADWGRPRCGWGSFEGEFVGLVWFLWRGTSMQASERMARELRDRLTQRFGDPTEYLSEPETGRFTALWQARGRTIDMYLHGGMRPRGVEHQFYDEPVLQLHLDDAERSSRREAEARRRPPPGRPQHGVTDA